MAARKGAKKMQRKGSGMRSAWFCGKGRIASGFPPYLTKQKGDLELWDRCVSTCTDKKLLEQARRNAQKACPKIFERLPHKIICS